ncbi:MAG: hypothetical protein L6R39_006350, partial [Caloplaca ligustica]
VFLEARVEFVQPSQLEVGHALFFVLDLSARADIVRSWHAVQLPSRSLSRMAPAVKSTRRDKFARFDEGVRSMRGVWACGG